MPTQPVVPEAPQVTNQEALHMHNEGTPNVAGIDAATLAEAQRLRQESTNPRDFLEKVAKDGISTSSFSSEKVKQFGKSFGGGKVDAAGNFIGDAGSVEERYFNEAARVVKELTDFQRYAEIMVEARRTGQAPDAIANGQLEGYANYDELRTAALRAIAVGITEEVEPEFAALTDIAEVQTVVEERLATDPAFRREIATALSKVKLPSTEIAGNTEATTLNERVTELTAQQTRAKAEIKNFIQASGIDINDYKKTRPDPANPATTINVEGAAALDYVLTDYIQRNFSKDNILSELKSDFYTPAVFGNKISEFTGYLQLEQQIKDAEHILATVDRTRDRVRYDEAYRFLNGTPDVPPAVTITDALIEDNLRAELRAAGIADGIMNNYITDPTRAGDIADRRLAIRGRLEAQNQTANEARMVAEGAIDRRSRIKAGFDANRNDKAKFEQFLRLNEAFSPTERIATRIEELLRTKSAIEEATTRRAQSETTSNQATSETRDKRLEQERAAIAELQSILPKAVATTILERARAADAVRQRENITNFNTETRQMLDTVRRSMRERGFGHTDAGGRLVRVNDRDLILDDARALATMKDEGLRRLVLIHMGLAGQNRIDDQGNPVAGGGVIENPDHLNTRQRALYDSIFASEGQAIKQKVATDLVASQGFMDKLRDKIPGTDKNGLNTVEWEEFGKYYNNDMKKIVESTQEGKRALASLEAAGIKPDTKNWTKWLLWLAAIIGGGTAIASLGGLTTIIPATAGTGFAAIKAVATGVSTGSGAVVNG